MVFLLQVEHFPPTSPQLSSPLSSSFATGVFQHWLVVLLNRAATKTQKQIHVKPMHLHPHTCSWQTAHKSGWHKWWSTRNTTLSCCDILKQFSRLFTPGKAGAVCAARSERAAALCVAPEAENYSAAMQATASFLIFLKQGQKLDQQGFHKDIILSWMRVPRLCNDKGQQRIQKTSDNTGLVSEYQNHEVILAGQTKLSQHSKWLFKKWIWIWRQHLFLDIETLNKLAKESKAATGQTLQVL